MAKNSSSLHPTRNSLGEKTRQQAVDVLLPVLTDAVDLQTQLKQAHWNIRGADFQELHELFDEISKEALEWADLLAERIAQLGGRPMGTARFVAKASSLKEYPLDAVASKDHLRAVSRVLADFGAAARKAIDELDEVGDKCGADICTEICRAADKQLWFVEAHEH